MIELHNIFDKIYIINLEHRKDRLIKTLFQINKTLTDSDKKIIRIFKGFNGKKKVSEQITDCRYINCKYSSKLSDGERGIRITILNILEDAIKNKYENILIFEDDIIFHKKFYEYFQNIKFLNKKWYLLFFGAFFYKNKPHKIFKNFYIPFNSDICGAFSVGFNKNVYKLIYHTIMKNYDSPSDRKPFIKLIQLYTKQMKIFMFNPNIIISDVFSQSDIRIIEKTRKHILNYVDWIFEDYNIYNFKKLTSVYIFNILNQYTYQGVDDFNRLEYVDNIRDIKNYKKKDVNENSDKETLLAEIRALILARVQTDELNRIVNENP